MRVLVIVVIVVIVVVVIVTWESKANSSSSLTELQTGTELGNKEVSDWMGDRFRICFEY